jgi:hypothetical protein
MCSILTFEFAQNNDNASNRFTSAGRLQSARKMVGLFGAVKRQRDITGAFEMKRDAIQPLSAPSQVMVLINIVTRLFKHCPLRGKSLVNKQAVAKQRPVTTTEELLETVISMVSVPRLYIETLLSLMPSISVKTLSLY